MTLCLAPVTETAVTLVTRASLEEIRDQGRSAFSLWPSPDSSWRLFVSTQCVLGSCSDFLFKVAEYKVK